LIDSTRLCFLLSTKFTGQFRGSNFLFFLRSVVVIFMRKYACVHAHLGEGLKHVDLFFCFTLTLPLSQHSY
jgi:hypothetical protein